MALVPMPVIAQSQTSGQLNVGLIFVGASWCAQCHLAAPLIQIAAAKNNLPLLVASRDNKPIPPFETFVPADGHPIAMQVQAFPALLIWSPRDQAIIARIDGIRSPRRYVARLNALIRELQEAGYSV